MSLLDGAALRWLDGAAQRWLDDAALRLLDGLAMPGVRSVPFPCPLC